MCEGIGVATTSKPRDKSALARYWIGMALVLDQAKALVFRITHRANLPWIMAHGLHCANSAVCDPGFVAIGNAELIGKRRTRSLPPPHGGHLSDYVPFYFTPFSPMMYKIVTGHDGFPRQ